MQALFSLFSGNLRGAHGELLEEGGSVFREGFCMGAAEAVAGEDFRRGAVRASDAADRDGGMKFAGMSASLQGRQDEG